MKNAGSGSGTEGNISHWILELIPLSPVNTWGSPCGRSHLPSEDRLRCLSGQQVCFLRLGCNAVYSGNRTLLAACFAYCSTLQNVYELIPDYTVTHVRRYRRETQVQRACFFLVTPCELVGSCKRFGETWGY
jgi:hypothetical protein